MAFASQRIAVFSMLADKDMAAVVGLLKDEFDVWLVGGLDMPRGRSADDIASELEALGVRGVSRYETVPLAWDAALSQAGENDRIVVFGSFHTVAEVMEHRLHRAS